INQARSPRIRRASWMSLGMMVTRLAWMAHRLVSSNSPTRYASAASCSAATAELWKRRSVLKSWAISRTRRWKGSLRMSSSVLFWYLRISRSATVPGLKRCGFFTPPVAGADLHVALVASCFLESLTCTPSASCGSVSNLLYVNKTNRMLLDLI
ncbi:Os06g0159700, partial [Oryza sativa Japonica Group]